MKNQHHNDLYVAGVWLTPEQAEEAFGSSHPAEELARQQRIDRCTEAWLQRPEFEGWTPDEVRDAAEQLVNERIRQEREEGWEARG